MSCKFCIQLVGITQMHDCETEVRYCEGANFIADENVFRVDWMSRKDKDEHGNPVQKSLAHPHQKYMIGFYDGLIQGLREGS